MNTARTKNGRTYTGAFIITRGCNLSPAVFKVYLHRALEIWSKRKSQEMGLQVDQLLTSGTATYTVYISLTIR